MDKKITFGADRVMVRGPRASDGIKLTADKVRVSGPRVDGSFSYVVNTPI